MWQVGEMGVEVLNTKLWAMYGMWNISIAPEEVDGHTTWPMPFDGACVLNERA